MVIHVKKKTAMKKTYQNPEMKLVKIQMQQIIAASVGIGDKYDGTSTIQSRRFGGVWDDDDED